MSETRFSDEEIASCVDDAWKSSWHWEKNKFGRLTERGKAQRRADVEYKLSQVALRLRQLKLIAAQLGKEKQ